MHQLDAHALCRLAGPRPGRGWGGAGCAGGWLRRRAARGARAAGPDKQRGDAATSCRAMWIKVETSDLTLSAVGGIGGFGAS